jgi:nucleotide-binding universal stress UspA family protein
MKTLLVSVDFSPSTRAVIETAVELAKTSESEVVLHHSLLPPVVSTEYGVGLEMMQETIAVAERTARHQLEHIEDELTARGLRSRTLLTQGPAAAQILRLATKEKANLILLGSHGHTALYDLILGSTTHAVLRKAECPVMVVPSALAKKHFGPKKKRTKR